MRSTHSSGSKPAWTTEGNTRVYPQTKKPTISPDRAAGFVSGFPEEPTDH